MPDNASFLRAGGGALLTVLGLAAVLVGRFIAGPILLGTGIYLLYTYRKTKDSGEQK